MNALKRISVVILGVLVLAVAGCAAQRQSMGEYFDDAGITTRVKKAIYDDPSLKSTDISVATERGVVHLTGTAKNRGGVVRAGVVARKVEGVKAVKNDLKVGK
jgi:osmotically-inducible protein OsmY